MSQGLIPLVSLMDKLLETDQAEESFQLLAYAHNISKHQKVMSLKIVCRVSHTHFLN